MHTKQNDALTNSGCGLRPKAYNTKRTLATALTGKNAFKSHLIFRKPNTNAYNTIRRGYNFRVRLRPKAYN